MNCFSLQRARFEGIKAFLIAFVHGRVMHIPGHGTGPTLVVSVGPVPNLSGA